MVYFIICKLCRRAIAEGRGKAQADVAVAVAMNTGTQAAKEAGNMVDLDFSPTKLIEIVRIGKQLLMTRGSLTTFSIANDLAKYFAITPALFMSLYPGLQALNIMGLHSAESAILSAVIYNALVIIVLIPLALKGVKYREVSASRLLSRNLLVYGLGGMITPFIFVKLIDMLIQLLAWSRRFIMESIKKILPRAIGFVLLLTVICGGLYALVVTGIAQIAFPNAANGSIIEIDGKQYGSERLAQNFSDENHLWGRIMEVDTETFKDESGQPLMTAVPSNISTSSQAYNALI